MAKVVSSSNIASGATLNQDVVLGASEWLTVIAIVGPTATAAADVSVNVQPYTDESSTVAPVLAPLNLPTADAVAAVLSASRAYIFARYRVAGIRKVQIQAKNANVGALPVEIDFQIG